MNEIDTERMTEDEFFEQWMHDKSDALYCTMINRFSYLIYTFLKRETYIPNVHHFDQILNQILRQILNQKLFEIDYGYSCSIFKSKFSRNIRLSFSQNGGKGV